MKQYRFGCTRYAACLARNCSPPIGSNIVPSQSSRRIRDIWRLYLRSNTHVRPMHNLPREFTSGDFREPHRPWGVYR